MMGRGQIIGTRSGSGCSRQEDEPKRARPMRRPKKEEVRRERL